jgi:hypothetical protein
MGSCGELIGMAIDERDRVRIVTESPVAKEDR